METNPANYQWKYMIEDMIESEPLEEAKDKLKRCLDSLQRYPLVIHSLDHCLLLRHFDNATVKKMKELLKQQENLLNQSHLLNLSPIRASGGSPERSPIRSSPVNIESPTNFSSPQVSPASSAPPSPMNLSWKSSIASPVKSPSNKSSANSSIASPPKSHMSSPLSSPAKSPVISPANSPLNSPVGSPVKSSLTSPMHSLVSEEDDFEYASQLQDDEDKRRREQEEKDFELAMKLSQEEEEPFGMPFKFSAESAASAFQHFSDIKNLLKDSDDDENDDKSTQITDSSKPSTSNFQSVVEDKTCDELGLPGPSSKRNPWSDDEDSEEDEFDAMINRLKSPIKHHNISWSSEDKPKTPPKAIEKPNKAKKKRTTKKKDDENVDPNLEHAEVSPAPKKAKTCQKYYPKPGSGGYAILIALYQNQDDRGYLTKSELCELSQQFCNESMTQTRPGANQFYTGWSASSTLAKKELIEMWGNPKKVKLTEEGKILAQEIWAKRQTAESQLTSSSQKLSSTFDSASWLEDVDENQVSQGFCLNSLPTTWKLSKHQPEQKSSSKMDHPGVIQDSVINFQVVLIVDNMEVVGGSSGGKKSRKEVTIEELSTYDINHERKKLSIGDFVWIARKGSTELVLPYIVERKRMDDLRSSIMDGRYKEQKRRMQQSGIPNKIYLVEEIGNYKDVSSRPANQNFSKALDRNALDQAMSNTLIRDGFHVKITKNQKESMKFLAKMTQFLTQKFNGKTLKISHLKGILDEEHLLPFKDFYEHSRTDKPLSVREVFCNMLICQKGLSAGMAWAITDKYPTVRALKRAFNACRSDEEREKLVSGIPYDNGRKKIPASTSKTLFALFCDRDFQ